MELIWATHNTVDPGTMWNWIAWVHSYTRASLPMNTCFVSGHWSQHMQRTSCVPWSTSFYTRNVSVHGFWFLRGILKPIPHDAKGQPNFWGVKRCAKLSTARSAGTLPTVPRPNKINSVPCFRTWFPSLHLERYRLMILTKFKMHFSLPHFMIHP